MKKPKIQVIVGSIREGRNGEKVANWFMDAIKDNESADIELVDVKSFNLPFFDDPLTPSSRGDNEHDNPVVQKWLDKLKEADAYVVITAEYNHSIPGSLKNAIDFAFNEWHHKAIGFVGYGSAAGGSRAIEHLRQVAAEVKMYSVREQLLIPFVWEAFDEQGNLRERNESQKRVANTVLDEVVTLSNRLN